MHRPVATCLFAILLATSACSRVDTEMVTMQQAEKASLANLAALQTGDIARIDALYDKDVVAIDPVAAEMVNDSAGIHKFNESFVSLKFSTIAFTERRIQLLDSLGFVLTGKVYAESAAGPMKSADFRVTQVFRKQPDGTFLIINEHVSVAGPEG